jgi:hypothetical protein
LEVAGDALRQKLKGDNAAQIGIFGFVDDAHATSAQLFEDAVMGNRLADHSLLNGTLLEIGKSMKGATREAQRRREIQVHVVSLWQQMVFSGARRLGGEECLGGDERAAIFPFASGRDSWQNVRRTGPG